VIGLSLSSVAVNMAMGKAGSNIPNTQALLLAGISLGTTILVAIFAHRFLRLVPILIGVGVGYTVAALMGVVDFSKIAAAPWFAIPNFTAPQFNASAVLFMLPVALAPAIEHVGNVIAVGGVTGVDYTKKPGLHRTLAGDGLGVLFAGMVGGPPITTYAEVTGAVTLTRNFNPVIMTWAAVFAVAMAFVGKFNALLQSIPGPVMGGIMILLFGSIAAIGLKTLVNDRTDLEQPRNLIIVSVVLVLGIGGFSIEVGNFVMQGVSLCGVAAILLHLLLPRARKD